MATYKMTTLSLIQALIEHVRYVYITPRLSGKITISVVFSLFGVERQKKHEKIATLSIKPQSHLTILIHRT